MFLLKKSQVCCRHKDILLKIQIPVCNVKSILCRNWVFGPYHYMNDLAFRGVRW